VNLDFPIFSRFPAHGKRRNLHAAQNVALELNDSPSWIWNAKAISKILQHNFKFHEYLLAILLLLLLPLLLLLYSGYNLVWGFVLLHDFVTVNLQGVG
jgi:hypothetical protein